MPEALDYFRECFNRPGTLEARVVRAMVMTVGIVLGLFLLGLFGAPVNITPLRVAGCILTYMLTQHLFEKLFRRPRWRFEVELTVNSVVALSLFVLA